MNGENDRVELKTFFNVENFTLIKKFILEKGGKETYCNKYNTNPHYKFEIGDVYLNPEGGEKNINCDPEQSDFDELVIKTNNNYYFIKHNKSTNSLAIDFEGDPRAKNDGYLLFNEIVNSI